MSDPAFDRWQGEPDAIEGDRPGITASLRRYREVLIAATLIGAVVGYAFAQRAPVRYQANVALILSDPGDPTVLGGGDPLESADREVYLAKQAAIITSSVVLARALELLTSPQSPRDVRAELAVQPAADLSSISIVATGADPRSAAALANAVGTAYEQVTEEDAVADAERAIASLETLRSRVQENLDASPRSPDGRLTLRQQQLTSQIADIEQREQDITARAAVYASGVDHFERAELPTSPSQPKPRLAAALGGLVGLVAAGLWAWRAAARDQRAETRDDPARILGAALLGEVPRPPRVPQKATVKPVAPPGPDPGLEDAFHLVVASLEHELAGVSGNSIAVTSVGPGASRTATVLKIADAASQESRTILIIDADVRLRQLSQRVASGHAASEGNRQEPPMPGEPARADEYLDRLVSTDSGMVLTVMSNPDDHQHSAGSYRAVDVGHAVRSIGEMFDLVLIDTPALLSSSRALGVAGQADAVVLIVAHRVPLSRLRDVRDRLAFVKTPLIGYVYVRPRGLGLRTLRRRLRRRPSSTAGTRQPVTGPEVRS